MLVNSGRIHNLEYTFCSISLLGVPCPSTTLQSKLLAFGKALKIAKPLFLLIFLFLLPLVFLQHNLVLLRGKLYFFRVQCMQVRVNF